MHETVRGVEVLGGSRWTAAELHQIAARSTEAPLQVNGTPAGHVVNVRAVGGRLLADLRGVPGRVAALIRAGRFKRIGTEVYTDRCRGIRGVILTGGDLARLAPEPLGARGYGEGSATAIKRYVFDMRGAGCAQEHEEAEMDRFAQTDAVRPEDIDAAVVARVRAYQAQDPSLSFEAAYRQLPRRDPDLWRLYGEKTYATIVTVSDSPAEQRAAADWHQAGLEVLRLADAYQQASQELSREEAIHAVLRDNAELTRRYLRGSSPPGT